MTFRPYPPVGPSVAPVIRYPQDPPATRKASEPLIRCPDCGMTRSSAPGATCWTCATFAGGF